jgi:predicted transcriptional regulator
MIQFLWFLILAMANSDRDTRDRLATPTEKELLEENERRWTAFQENGEIYTHDEVVSHFEGLLSQR